MSSEPYNGSESNNAPFLHWCVCREAGDSDAAAAMTVEEALRIVQAATGGQGKKKHKEKHKKHEKHSKHKKSKKSKHSRKRSRSRGSGSSSRDSEASR